MRTEVIIENSSDLFTRNIVGVMFCMKKQLVHPDGGLSDGSDVALYGGATKFVS